MTMESNTFGSAAPQGPDPAQLRRLQAMRRSQQPPGNVLPVSWSFTALLGRSDTAAVTALGAHVYPDGLTFTIAIATRGANAAGRGSPHWNAFHGPAAALAGSDDTDRLLRLGIRFSDGRSWSNLDQPDLHTMMQGDVDPDQIRLFPRNGSGDGPRRWEQHVHLTPLPPDGDLTFFAAWPRFGIPETATTLDATGVGLRAAQAVTLWPDEDDQSWGQPKPRRLQFGPQGNSFFAPIIGVDPA